MGNSRFQATDVYSFRPPTHFEGLKVSPPTHFEGLNYALGVSNRRFHSKFVGIFTNTFVCVCIRKDGGTSRAHTPYTCSLGPHTLVA